MCRSTRPIPLERLAYMLEDSAPAGGAGAGRDARVARRRHGAADRSRPAALAIAAGRQSAVPELTPHHTGLRDLHLRFHRPAERRDQRARRGGQPLAVDAGRLSADGSRFGAAENPVQLRRVGVGVLLAADDRRAPGHGAARRAQGSAVPERSDRARAHHHAALCAVDARRVPRQRRHHALRQRARR